MTKIVKFPGSGPELLEGVVASVFINGNLKERTMMASQRPPRRLDKKTEQWIKGKAIHVVADLPDDVGQALLILEYAKKLVIEFLDGDEDDHPGIKAV